MEIYNDFYIKMAFWVLIEFWLNFILWDVIHCDNMALVKAMAWLQTVNKSLYKPMTTQIICPDSKGPMIKHPLDINPTPMYNLCWSEDLCYLTATTSVEPLWRIWKVNRYHEYSKKYHNQNKTKMASQNNVYIICHTLWCTSPHTMIIGVLYDNSKCIFLLKTSKVVKTFQWILLTGVLF